MDPIILMVGRVNEGVHDVEVMPDIPVADLADALALAFGWPGTYDIQVNGKMLGEHQTLASSDIWDGSQLTLVVSNRPSRLAFSGVGQQVQLSSPSSPFIAGGGIASTGSKRPLQVPGSQDTTKSGSPVSGKRALQVPSASPKEKAEGWKPVIPDTPAQPSLSSPVTGWRQTPDLPDGTPQNNDQRP